MRFKSNESGLLVPQQRLNFAVTPRDVHHDVALTNMAMGFVDPTFIADTIFPVVTVNKQSDKYAVWDRAAVNRIEDTLRAPGTEANIVDWDVSSNAYFARNFALKHRIPIETRANAEPIYMVNLLDDASSIIMRKLFLDWEQRIAGMVNSTSNVGSSAGVASSWSALTAGNSDPIGDLATALDVAEDITGARPRAITFGYKAWRKFRRHADVRNIIYGVNNGGGFVTLQQVAALMEVDKVQIGRVYYNSADEGLAEVVSEMWGKNVLLHYSPDAPSIREPSFGYTFRWAADGLANMQAERHPYDTKIKAEEVEIGYYQDEKITGAEYGFLLTNVVSA